ncbi:hypothetical protein FRB96_001534 [Tulasnella sp. 330]|nr:hypothetical protein FRB96_001534 [Tulasnella sp. 330]KAG8886596.1 hypothetical protein FRB97_000015 [Tulasnella sp. 331]
MSFVGAFLPEFQPFFRVLDDSFEPPAQPFADSPRSRPFRRTRRQDAQVERNGGTGRSFLSELGFGRLRSPRIQVAEDGDKYVINAEVPGMRKEELDVTIGDGGRSLHIQGGAVPPIPVPVVPVTPETGAASANDVSAQGSDSNTTTSDGARAAGMSTATSETTSENQVSEAQSQPQRPPASKFSRTIRLPRPVDSLKVTAKLDHGILTLELPKKVESAVQKIQIE